MVWYVVWLTRRCFSLSQDVRQRHPAGPHEAEFSSHGQEDARGAARTGGGMCVSFRAQTQRISRVLAMPRTSVLCTVVSSSSSSSSRSK